MTAVGRSVRGTHGFALTDTRAMDVIAIRQRHRIPVDRQNSDEKSRWEKINQSYGLRLLRPNTRPGQPGEVPIGVDTMNSAYGDVVQSRCRCCSAASLRFLIEYESFGHSSRWFGVPVPPAHVAGKVAGKR
jgi:hypothetical protein